LKINSGKVFYQLEIAKEPNTRLELMQFLKDKRFGDGEIQKVDFDYSNATGKSVELEGRNIKLRFKVYDSALMLMFETNMDSADMSEYIKGHFL
jgi:hypothetical protein